MTIEEIIIDYLGNHQELPVYAEKHEEDESFVVIQKTGGSRKNQIDFANVAVQTYASTKQQASELAEDIKNMMLDGLIGADSIGSIVLNSGPYDFPDTTSKRHRYQAFYNISYYGR